VKPTEIEAAWAALAGASACLGGLILDTSGVLDDNVEEPERAAVKAALLDGRAARDELAERLHREALAAAVALFDLDPNRDYSTLPELREVAGDGLAEADGLAEVLVLDGGELVPLASRMRVAFEATVGALPAA
jgi:hypothetical protein